MTHEKEPPSNIRKSCFRDLCQYEGDESRSTYADGDSFRTKMVWEHIAVIRKPGDIERASKGCQEQIPTITYQ